MAASFQAAVILTKVRIQSREGRRLEPWVLTFVRMTEASVKLTTDEVRSRCDPPPQGGGGAEGDGGGGTR
ncbi:hypothetical protein SPHINGO391_350120 [Sphingomonas aurantiaca]|uniref:Uncharacterized protein n=1 Tax=Sphingomonas aurantiaca TaxID=185949 RepID=A0A5E7Y5I2_9SPHN|nr:hypothetical protein SPHINGO391_350120 [Sphingomonas aurantiaca]